MLYQNLLSSVSNEKMLEKFDKLEDKIDSL